MYLTHACVCVCVSVALSLSVVQVCQCVSLIKRLLALLDTSLQVSPWTETS